MRNILLWGIFSTAATLFGIEPEESKIQIEKRMQEFIETINQHHGESLSNFWTEEASLSNPATGETYKGKKEISDYLQQRNQEIQQRNLSFTFKPEKIDFPNPDQAIVQGVIEIKDKDQLLQRNVRKIGLIKQNGQWYINEVREVESAPPPPVFRHLKELEWLIGNWKDADQDVSIKFSTKWDKFKNFIIQRFEMETYGVEALEGIQIIGWDPIEKNIRSWVFDSDGGFGEGFWAKKNGNWEVDLDYVLSDGSEGSATNIYSEINDRSYRYQSINRDIDGEPLDDIQPITVKKEEGTQLSLIGIKESYTEIARRGGGGGRGGGGRGGGARAASARPSPRQTSARKASVSHRGTGSLQRTPSLSRSRAYRTGKAVGAAAATGSVYYGSSYAEPVYYYPSDPYYLDEEKE